MSRKSGNRFSEQDMRKRKESGAHPEQDALQVMGMTRRDVLQSGGAIAAAALPSQAMGAQPVGPVMAALAGYMADARARPLPDDVVEKMKHHVLDTLAAMVSGAELAPGLAAIRFARAYGGEQVATVAGSDVRCGAIEAALANGVLAHADETDDS